MAVGISCRMSHTISEPGRWVGWPTNSSEDSRAHSVEFLGETRGEPSVGEVSRRASGPRIWCSICGIRKEGLGECCYAMMFSLKARGVQRASIYWVNPTDEDIAGLARVHTLLCIYTYMLHVQRQNRPEALLFIASCYSACGPTHCAPKQKL